MTSPVLPREDVAANRRQALILAAFGRIATEGFEGLRTRDVAADVGVNIATLHYYFPTKEALIRGVVGHAMRRFRDTLPDDGTPAEQLRAHLVALRRLILEDHQLFAVLGELALRSARDPAIAAIMQAIEDAWPATLRDLIRRGVEQGCLDADLDSEGVAALLVAAIKGISVPSVAPSRAQRVDRTFRQIERWLGLAPTDRINK